MYLLNVVREKSHSRIFCAHVPVLLLVSGPGADGAVTVHGFCSRYEIRACLGGTIFEQNFGNQNLQPLFVNYNVTEMKRVCRDIHVVKACWGDILPRCDRPVAMVIETFGNCVDYWCGEGYMKYMNNRECLSKHILALRGKACIEAFKRKSHAFIAKMTSGTFTKSQSRATICRNMHDVEKCVFDAVRSECPEEAAMFVQTFVDKMLHHPKILVACEKEDITLIDKSQNDEYQDQEGKPDEENDNDLEGEPEEEKNNETGSLSEGVIVLIVCAAILPLVVVIVLVYGACKRRLDVRGDSTSEIPSITKV